ncbi:MAG TPA: redoxin domain-containing protein [Bradyrhizobium sp.]|nr:redoxin domain-containing protein [Bradyrhizobium sp.]
MSKKTRKKSPKTPSRKAPKTLARKSGTGAARTAAKTPAKKTVKKPATASHKATSKKLKAAAPVTAKPTPQNPPVNKPRDANVAATPGKALLSEGAKAPAFQLPRDGGNSVTLADYLGKKLVVFFYPRADTPGCTKEAIDFTRLSGAFADSQTAVLGVSADPLKAQEAFRDKHQLSIPLVSDETHEMLQAYGVWGEKSMYGKTFLGILRTTVLIDRSGKVARIWRNVKVDGHADEVLAAAQAL